jgi:protocatechuate 3,4-dioxygenase beta subunit
MLGLRFIADSKRFHLRGRFRADSSGRYLIETVVPGHYPWPFTRARHIHFIIAHAGYVPLTTQVFFSGDQFLERDPWVKHELIISLREEPHTTSSSRYVGAFDFVLERDIRSARRAA